MLNESEPIQREASKLHFSPSTVARGLSTLILATGLGMADIRPALADQPTPDVIQIPPPSPVNIVGPGGRLVVTTIREIREYPQCGVIENNRAVDIDTLYYVSELLVSRPDSSGNQVEDIEYVISPVDQQPNPCAANKIVHKS